MPNLSARWTGRLLGHVYGELGALSRAPDVTSATSPGVGPPVHDISPLLLDQLVLELEPGKRSPKVSQSS
jgi:hypothetical protein